MIIRNLDGNHDWTFGKGRNDYKRNIPAVALNIETRLLEFLGDCFFDMGKGIDWFNLLGSKDQPSLQLAISSVILNTQDVTGLLNLSTNLNPTTRALTVSYEVQTALGTAASTFTFDSTIGG